MSESHSDTGAVPRPGNWTQGRADHCDLARAVLSVLVAAYSQRIAAASDASE